METGTRRSVRTYRHDPVDDQGISDYRRHIGDFTDNDLRRDILDFAESGNDMCYTIAVSEWLKRPHLGAIPLSHAV